MNSYIDETDNKEKIYCPICDSKGWIRLGKHLSRVHNLTRKEFESQYPGFRVCTKEFSKARSDQITDQRANDPVFMEITRQNGSNTLKKLHQDKEWEKNLTEKAAKGRRKRWREDPEFAKYMNDLLNAGKTEWLKDPDNYKYIQECARQEMLLEWEFNELFIKNHNKKLPVEYICLDDSIIKMRSTWEARLAQFFDDNLVINWEYESLKFKYELDNGRHVYTPDFYLRDRDLVIEVKPFKFTNDDAVLAKRNAVLNKGHNFIFITENELWNEETLKTIFNVN